MSVLTKIFGTTSSRELKKIQPVAKQVEALEDEYRKLTDAELKAKTDEFRSRYQQGESLDDLLPEAFATVREASDRVLGMRHYPVQIIGGIVLHRGSIAEMKTGEGKTLVATLPAYLNAISGEGVHIVTVNDYLAKRDSEWMGKVYTFLGMTVGLIVHGLTPDQRRRAYAADITYGTNNEFGFDYLRDNMAIYAKELVQRGHAYAIVDEVDSILIDEARTPLIISGKGEKSTQLYQMADQFVRTLKKLVIASTDTKEEEDVDLDADYVVDEKARTATLTAHGIEKAERAFNLENLSDPENTTLSHHINQALKAHGVFKRDIDYVVKDGEVIIVDEFTGRLMFGRRYNEGLHQAIEAKEHVTVANESKTLATITFQNFFRLYHKLAGMTGTAMTEEAEFNETYKLDIVEIPTNRAVIRVDHPDVVFKNTAGKYRAIVKQIAECHEKGQPVLVGTISIEKSEYLSKLLTRAGIHHNVLNAKHHEKEAEIVAQAGKLGAVTVATNMAGRGTDIMLGGNAEYMAKADLRKQGLPEELIVEADGFAETSNPEILDARKQFTEAVARHKAEIKDEARQVREAGGLFILGTERHDARRIDNQLRGRSGRQGDPGESRFYLSLEDDIMRLFGSERVAGMMEGLGVDEDTPIDAKVLSNAIENAQKKVESKHFQARKSTLQYDDVMNTQRSVIYEQRRKVLDGEDLRSSIESMIHGVIAPIANGITDEHGHVTAADWNRALNPFLSMIPEAASLRMTEQSIAGHTAEELTERLDQLAMERYRRKEEEFGELPDGSGTPLMREVERVVMLRVVDEYWMDQIDAMAELRQGIGLRAYAQTDPVIAYKKEGYEMFDAMIAAIREETVRRLFTVQLRVNQEVKRERVAQVTGENAGGDGTVKKQPVRRDSKKVGRNEPCPCGSGLKYKKCCGIND